MSSSIAKRVSIIFFRCNPISGIIRVKSCNTSDNNETDKVITNEISTTTFPAVRTHSARTSFSLINRSLTPKISSKRYGYRYRLHRKSQKSCRSFLPKQQKEKENEAIETDRKSNNAITVR